MSTTFSIPLSAITPFTRGRDNIDPEKVNRLVALHRRGVVPDAIAVFRRPGDQTWSVFHGHHRVVSAEAVGHTHILATEVPAPIKLGARSGKPLS